MKNTHVQAPGQAPELMETEHPRDDGRRGQDESDPFLTRRRIGEAFFRQGLTALAERRLATAVSLIGEAVRYEPYVVGFHLILGRLNSELDRPDASLQAFERALVLAPGRAAVLVARAAAARRAGRPTLAVTWLTRAVTIAPNEPEIHADLARSLDRIAGGRAGWSEQALSHWVIAAALAPGEASRALDLGDALWRRGRPEAALRQYREAARREPDSRAAWRSLALVAGERDDWALMTEATRRLLALDPDDVEPLVSEARVSLRSGGVSVADRRIRLALSVDPADAEVLRLAAAIQREAGRDDRAFALGLFALRVDPTEAGAWVGVADLHEAAGRGPAAGRCRRVALALDPTGVEALVVMTGPAPAADGEIPVGVRRAVLAAGGAVHVLTRLGGVLARRGWLEVARRVCCLALVVAPAATSALCDLGLIATRLETEGEEESRWLNRAATVAQTHALARLVRELVGLGRGDGVDTPVLPPSREESPSSKPALSVAPAQHAPPVVASDLRWQGQPLAGRHLVVRQQGGLATEIAASRHFEPMTRSAAGVVIVCALSLLPLFRRSVPRAVIRPASAHATAFDDGHLWTTTDQLAALKDTGIVKTPAAGWLVPDAERAGAIGRALGGHPALRLGLCGLVARDAVVGAARGAWDRLLSHARVSPVGLDGLDPVTGGLCPHHHRRVRPAPVAVGDIEGLAALIANLDLVVGLRPTGMIGALAVGLGVPVWMAVGGSGLGSGWPGRSTVGTPRGIDHVIADIIAIAERLFP